MAPLPQHFPHRQAGLATALEVERNRGDEVLDLVRGRETGQGGELGTRQPEFLAPRARAQTPEFLGALQRLTEETRDQNIVLALIAGTFVYLSLRALRSAFGA